MHHFNYFQSVLCESAIKSLFNHKILLFIVVNCKNHNTREIAITVDAKYLSWMIGTRLNEYNISVVKRWSIAIAYSGRKFRKSHMYIKFKSDDRV